MTPDFASVLLGLAFGLLLAAIYVLWWRLRYTRAVRRDAVQRSEAVTVGKVSEQLLPFFPEFGFNPRDARFLGTPVDLLVFDGLAEGRCARVVFVEVKTRSSSLSPRERLVRDAIRAGRVEWLELRIGAASG
jgi:predicted Holliday junction resolvase-like endonuclease